jgi:RHS repeat-associated protein
MPRVRAASGLASCLLVLCTLHFAGCPGDIPAPAAGAPDYQTLGWVAVPFARVNAMGGNLLVERRDLDLDTRLGNLRLEAFWNSADAAWRFGFELSYDGRVLVDANGARHELAEVPDGRAVPGTVWVRVDARTLRTKGGLVHEFDAQGRLGAVRWSSAPYPRLEYRRASVAGGSRLVAIRQWAKPGDDVQLASFGYDGAGRLVAIDDRAGRRVRFAWDAAGRLVAARDALDIESGWPGFRYEYAGAQLSAITSSEGTRVELAYEDGRVSAVRARGEGDPAFRFAYGRAGTRFRTTVGDPLGRDTRFVWDGSRRLLELESPAGERATWTWQGLRPDSFRGPGGFQSSRVYFDDDPLVDLYPSGNAVTFSWAPDAENRADPSRRPLARASDSLGLLRENQYDAQGRLVSTRNGAGERLGFAWNAANLLAASTDAAGIETRFEDYGVHGHPRRVERGGLSQEREYDAVGNLLSGRGSAALPGLGDSGVVSRGYDADRNLARVVLGNLDLAGARESALLAIEYRSDGRPLRIARPGGGDSELVYDRLGREVERRDRASGAWRSTRFERDLLGRVTAVRRPNGMETRLAYDAAGRRSSLAHLRGGALESSATFGYAAGRLASIADSAHGQRAETYAYDAAGRPTRVRYPDGERLELRYDVRSRVTEERYVAASGVELRTLRFGYDAAGRENLLRDGSALLRALSFREGRLAEERFGNGLVREHAYGADGLLREVTMRDAAGALVERTRCEATPIAASVEWRAATSSFGALAATSHERFLLAPIGAGEPGPRAAGFSSDADGGDFLLYAYDVLGNVVRTGAPDEARRTTFSYDAERTRLLRVRRADGATLRQYAYDEAGFAIARDGEEIGWDGGGRAASLGTRASFRWDALGRPVASAAGGLGQRRLFGGRVRASAAGVASAIELGALEVDLLGAHRYRHLDFRGNVKLVSDERGRILAHVRYGPYGPDRAHGVPDPEAGFAQGRSLGDLWLLGARLYDPEAARFLAPDPVFQLVNQYAYAYGNPVWYWDPDGRLPASAAAFAIGVGVVGTGAGVTVVAVAAAGTGIAAPAALIVGIGIIAYSNGYMLGAVAPPGGLATEAAGAAGWALGGMVRIHGGFGPIGGLLVGFDRGQAFAAEHSSVVLPSPPPSTPPPPPPGPPGPTPDGEQGKEITLRVEPPQVPTCSPSSLTYRSPADALYWLAAGVVLQLALLGVRLRIGRARRESA